jgi:outer membrane protein TolC
MGLVLLLSLASRGGAQTGEVPVGASAATTPTTGALDFEGLAIPDRLGMPPVDAGGRLSRTAAVQIALRENAGLAAARRRVEAARAEYRRRSAANNPTLSLGGTVVPRPREDEPVESQFPDTDETYLSYVFPTSGSRRHATRSARARLLEAEATYRIAELDLVQQTQQAYVDLQVSQEAIRIYEDSYRIAVRLVDIARQQVQVGAVPETNVVRTRIEQARAEQDILRSHYERLGREAQLAFLTGVPARRRLAASDPLSPPTRIATLEALADRAQAARPEMAAARAELGATRAEVDVARAQRRPDLTIQAQFTDELTNTGNPPFKAAIQLPLWDRGRIGGEVAQARAQVGVADATVIQTGRQVDLDVTRAYRQVESARAVLGIFQAEVLPHTRTILDRARIRYTAGTGTLLDILDAQRVYRQSSLDVLAATGDLARAIAGLERAVAGPVDPGGPPGDETAATASPRTRERQAPVEPLRSHRGH